jgi:hypothetical protein
MRAMMAWLAVGLGACQGLGTAAVAPGTSDAAIGGYGGDDDSLDPSDGGDYQVICPTKAPVDLDAPGLKEQCTKPLYLAGANFSRVYTSPDAVNWTLAATLAGSDGQYQRVWAFTSGLGFLVNAGDSGVAVSADGIKWNVVAGGWPYGTGLLFAHDAFAQYGGGTSYSSDGVAWYGTPWYNNFTNGVKADFTPSDMAFFGGRFFAVGAHDPGNGMPKQPAYRSSSDDGKTWSDDTVVSAAVGDSLVGAAASATALVVVGQAGFIASSTDGNAWTDRTAKTQGDGNFSNIVWDGLRFIAVSSSHFFLSPDGASWSAVDNTKRLSRILPIEAGYLGFSGSTLYLSPDLATWTQVLQIEGPLWSLGAGRILK